MPPLTPPPVKTPPACKPPLLAPPPRAQHPPPLHPHHLKPGPTRRAFCILQSTFTSTTAYRCPLLISALHHTPADCIPLPTAARASVHFQRTSHPTHPTSHIPHPTSHIPHPIPHLSQHPEPRTRNPEPGTISSTFPSILHITLLQNNQLLLNTPPISTNKKQPPHPFSRLRHGCTPLSP